MYFVPGMSDDDGEAPLAAWQPVAGRAVRHSGLMIKSPPIQTSTRASVKAGGGRARSCCPACR